MVRARFNTVNEVRMGLVKLFIHEMLRPNVFNVKRQSCGLFALEMVFDDRVVLIEEAQGVDIIIHAYNYYKYHKVYLKAESRYAI